MLYNHLIQLLFHQHITNIFSTVSVSSSIASGKRTQVDTTVRRLNYKLTVLLIFQVPQYSLCRCPIVNDWVVQETFLKRARPSQCPFGTLELSNSSCPNCLCGFFLPLLPFRRLFSDIFSRRFSSDKSPNITVASFFYHQTTISLWLGHFSYNLNHSNYYHKAKSGQRNLVQKGPPISFFYFFNVTYKMTRLNVPPFRFFSALCVFSRKFLNVSNESPFRVFLNSFHLYTFPVTLHFFLAQS